MSDTTRCVVGTVSIIAGIVLLIAGLVIITGGLNIEWPTWVYAYMSLTGAMFIINSVYCFSDEGR